jgi:hypothetical protein
MLSQQLVAAVTHHLQFVGGRCQDIVQQGPEHEALKGQVQRIAPGGGIGDAAHHLVLLLQLDHLLRLIAELTGQLAQTLNLSFDAFRLADGFLQG